MWRELSGDIVYMLVTDRFIRLTRVRCVYSPQCYDNKRLIIVKRFLNTENKKFFSFYYTSSFKLYCLQNFYKLLDFTISKKKQSTPRKSFQKKKIKKSKHSWITQTIALREIRMRYITLGLLSVVTSTTRLSVRPVLYTKLVSVHYHLNSERPFFR